MLLDDCPRKLEIKHKRKHRKYADLWKMKKMLSINNGSHKTKQGRNNVVLRNK